MLKQSHNRNPRTNGYKVKQGLQIFTLIVVGIWLLYQLKHSHENKILGRKGLQLWMKKPYELMGDAKERKTEIFMKENTVEEEEPEDVEDMIDEEDKEEEEENEAVDADMSLFEYQSHTEGEKETQPTTQKHFKNVVVP
ncbi:transmembrane protein, putative [Medicago truncatula]|uniref:Transmembrane protein, putative n=1 Tax=Medicago truncatula TaxID=3880 RepID=G7J409_MEDTR|nr:transmembrane protein, putative [Medicago truncatula]